MRTQAQVWKELNGNRRIRLTDDQRRRLAVKAKTVGRKRLMDLPTIFTVDDIKRAGPLFEKAGAQMYVPLQVSAAFHSRYMADAAKAFADFLAPMSFAAPRIPVLSNVTAQPYPVQNASESVKSLLVQQVTHSVRWTESIRFLIGQHVTEFTEIGPGNVLTRMVHCSTPKQPDDRHR